jgi:hypothetical protein
MRAGLLVAVAAAVAVAGVVIVPGVRHSKQVTAREERQAHRALVARTRRRLAEDQRPRNARATSRAAALEELQLGITRDARDRFRRHLLPGPPVRTTLCQPVQANRSSPGVGRRFTCLAKTSPALGFEFVAVIDDRRLRLTWCKTNPEGLTDAKPLATVPLQRSCFSAGG